MGNRPMICALCVTKRWYPRDFPNTTYAICRTCTDRQELEEAQKIEARTRYFFYVLMVVCLAIVIAAFITYCR